jgi:HSP20 family molecular chaperone IbpA
MFNHRGHFGEHWGQFDAERRTLMHRGIVPDFQENDAQYMLKVTVPGIEKENIELDVIGNTLLLTIKLDDENTIERALRFPHSKAEAVAVTLKNGVLEIIIPKLEKKKINIA